MKFQILVAIFAVAAIHESQSFKFFNLYYRE
jgi:hypothetical protein